MSKKNYNYHMDEGLNASENAYTDTDDRETVLADSSELLIDEILKEFGSKEMKSGEKDASIDDEVAKILKSVKLSMETEEELAALSEGALDYSEGPTSPVNKGSDREPELSAEDTAGSQSELSPEGGKEAIDNNATAPKVKVLLENDSSPIFGDNFAKYFGPDAGLAAEIEIFEAEDQLDDGDGKRRTLFRRKRKKKRDKHSVEEKASYITSDTIAADVFTAETGASGDNSAGEESSESLESLDSSDSSGTETERLSSRRRRKAIEKAGIISEEMTQHYDADADDYEEIIDLSPEDASKALIDDMGLIRVRLFFGVILCAILVYISIAPRVGMFLPSSISYVINPYLYLFICTSLLIFVMIMCVKTVAIGIRDFLLLRPNMESVIALSCVLSLVHTVSIIVMPQWEGYFPYCAVSATSLMFAEYFRYKSQTAHVRTYKAVSAMSKPYLVSCENSIYSGQDATVKYKVAEPLYFVHQTVRKDLVTKAWSYAAPLVIILAIVCAAVSSIGRGQSQRFIWALSAMLTAAAPFSLCLSYRLPFSKTARHLGMMGHAITGWSAAEEMSLIDSVIITDTDLFPPGSIVLNGLKIYGGYAVDKVISYSASIVAASYAGTTKPFLDLLHDQATTQHKVSGFQYYENGGIGGDINGESVIAGTAAFMMRTGIRIPKDVNVKNAIFIAINLELAGVFAVNYNVNTGIKKALRMLIKNGLNPVLAIRDFNITPAMLESKFNISSDTADYPPIEDRLSLSNPDRVYSSKPLAAIGREGLTHYAECIIMARNLKRATQICLGITFTGIIIGMLLMFYLLYSHSPVQASPFNLLLYMALWLVPNLIAARWAKM